MKSSLRRLNGQTSAMKFHGYLHWNAKGSDQKCHPACSHLRVPKLTEEEYVPDTFTVKQVAAIIAWKPRKKIFYERRPQALLLTLFDAGMRIDEALSLRVEHCNLDDLLFAVTGKGRKQRVIPLMNVSSPTLKSKIPRFVLYPWVTTLEPAACACAGIDDSRKSGAKPVTPPRKSLLSDYSGGKS